MFYRTIKKLKRNPNNWFHEAICELASVFTIRRMAQRWHTHPAFPKRTDYTAALRDYWQNLLGNQNAQLPEGMVPAYVAIVTRE